MSKKTDRELLEEMNRKLDLLLDQKYGASEKPTDELQGRKSPRNHHKKSNVIDLKTMYRKRGII